MLSDYNPVDIHIILDEENPPPPFPPARDRAAWAAVAEAIGPQRVAAIIAEAEQAAAEPIPALTATLYLEFRRNGQREGYQEPLRQRRAMLSALTLAECLEYQGRFLDPLLDVAWAICEESSWVMPAHQTDLEDMNHRIIDLGSASTGLILAEMDALLGADLDPALAARIRYEVNERSFRPFLERHDFWWLHNTQYRTVNNWTAVCNNGVVGAAIYLETDSARLAEMIARAARSLDDYLTTFDRDGGSTEGPGYWGYGFGNYVMLGQLVEHRTNGRVRFLDGALIRDVGQFPLRTILSPGWWANFSDADPRVSYPSSLLAYLAGRLDLPGLLQIYQDTALELRTHRQGELPWVLRDLFWRIEPAEQPRFVPAAHNWYSEMHWMLARYDPADRDGLVLAAKGGHNGEMHNQNDVGNYILHWRGESLVADVGRGRYTKAYFSTERYTFFVNQSLGHSLPVPNGQMQGPLSSPRRSGGITLNPDSILAREFHAELLDHGTGPEGDRLVLEMKAAYPPEADLESLRRTVKLVRQAPYGHVEVVDEVQFASGPGTFETAVTTFFPAVVQDGAVIITGERGALRIAYDPAVVTARVDVVADVDLADGPRDVNRIAFALNGRVQAGVIALTLTPQDR